MPRTCAKPGAATHAMGCKTAPGFTIFINLTAVIGTSFLRIAQNLIGRRNLFEALTRGLVVRVDIGMKFFRELSKGTANFVVTGVSAYT